MSSALLNIANRGLMAAQGSLATIAHNIANANTAGYSRQQAMLSTAPGLFTGSGFFGRGVDVTTVRRHYDQFLTGMVQSTAAESAADSARADALASLDSVFAETETGIGARLDALFGAAGDLAARPADGTARQAFLSQAALLGERLSSTGRELAELGRLAEGRITHAVAQANARLSELRALNNQISHAQATGHSPNDLLDQRDQALAALNALVAVSVTEQADGSVAVFSRTGAALLVGGQQSELRAVADPADPARLALELRIGPVAQPLEGSALGGGALAGTLRFRDVDLAAATAQVGRLAFAIAQQFNAQQALGRDADGQPGAAMFSVAAPAALAHGGNGGTALLTAGVSDSAALRASDYHAAYDGSAWTITRLSDGQRTTAAALPVVVDGLRLQASGTPLAGDSFLVRPYEAAAQGLRAAALSVRQVASAYAATIEAAATNRGGARAAAFDVVRAHADNTLPVTVTFNDPPTSFNVTGLAGGDLANVPYVSGQAVPAAPADYNGWRMVLDGAPVAGDRFEVRATAAPAADNRNARAFAALADKPLVEGMRLNEAFASLIGDVGVRVHSANQTVQVSSRLQAEAQERQQAVAGVNLDEEASNLLRFQQSYQAAARVIQASQTLFEALLDAARR